MAGTAKPKDYVYNQLHDYEVTIMTNLSPQDVDTRLTETREEFSAEHDRLWNSLDDERISRIAGDETNAQSLQQNVDALLSNESRLSTEVVQREEGDLRNIKSLTELAKALSDYRIKTDLEINNEKIAREQLGIDLNTRVDNFISTFDHKFLLVYQTIENLRIETHSSLSLFDERIKKYEEMLQDITTDSIQITMDNGEINMGAWTILSQARQWDLEILGMFKDYQTSTNQDIEDALKDIQDNLPIEQDIIDKAIDALSNATVIQELDNKITGNIGTTNLLHEALIKEASDRQNEMILYSQTIANELKANQDALLAEVRSESEARVDALQREASIRQQELLNEALERSAEIDERIKDIEGGVTTDLTEAYRRIDEVNEKAENYKADSDRKLQELNDEADQIHSDISAEQDARIAAIKKVEDGLTQEIAFRKEGDNASMLAIDNYKTSNDLALANVREELATNVTATTANATAIQALDTQLVIVGDEATAAKNLAASATQKAETALSETSALASQMTTVNASIDGIQNALADKADAAAFNNLKAQVTDLDGVVQTTASDVTALKTQVSDIDSTVTGQASAISELNSTQTAHGENLTQLNNSTTALRSELDIVKEDVSQKVGVTAFNELKTEVDRHDNSITVISQDVTNLNASLDTVTASLETKAEAGAVSALQSKVESIDGKVVSNSESILRLDGQVATIEEGLNNKLDASVIQSYYTKVETDQVVAGEISEYDTNLYIGGQNLWSVVDNPLVNVNGTSTKSVINSAEEHYRTTVNTFNTSSVCQAVIHNALVDTGYIFKQGDDFTLSFEVRAVRNSKIASLYFYMGGQGVNLVNNQNVTTDWVRVVLPVKANGILTSNDSQMFGTSLRSSDGWAVNDWIEFRHVQLQRGKKATEYQKASAKILQTATANATAISGIKSSIENLDGRITSNSNSITSLSNDVTQINNELSTKASSDALNDLKSTVEVMDGKVTSNAQNVVQLTNDVTQIKGDIQNMATSSALEALDSRVVTAEGKLESQQSSITKLQGDLATTASDVSKKADASALNALDQRVVQTEAKVVSQGTSITNLQNNVSTINSELAKKADSSALTSLSSRVAANEDSITSQGSTLTSLQNSINSVGVNLVALADQLKTVSMTSTEGESYITWSLTDPALKPDTFYTLSFWALRTPNVKSVEAFLIASNGAHHKSAIVAVSTAALTRYSIVFKTNANATGVTYSLRFDLNGSSDGNNATLTVQKPQLEVGQVVTYWKPSTYDKADASALSTLQNTVTQQGNALTSNSNAITTLQNNVNTINDSLATKADASALSILDSKVVAIDGKVTSNTASLTALSNAVTNGSNNLIYNTLYNDLSYISASGNHSVAIDSATYARSKVLKITATGAGQDGVHQALMTASVATVPSATDPLVLSFFAKADTSVSVRIQLFGGVGLQSIALTNTWTKYTISTLRKTAAHLDTTTLYLSLLSAGVAYFTNVQLERGTIPTSYSAASTETGNLIAANSTALSSLSSTVTQHGNALTSQGNSITSLNNSLVTTNSNVEKAQNTANNAAAAAAAAQNTADTKADASAFNALSNAVSNQGDTISSQGSAITALNNTLNSLSVGSTNLLPGTDLSTHPSKDGTFKNGNMISATATTAGSVDMLALKSTVELLAGEYVVSFWAKAETAGTQFGVYFYNPNTTVSGVGSNGASSSRADGQIIFTLTTVMTKYYVKYKQSGNTSKKDVLFRIQAPASGTNKVWLALPQLEEGNVVTDWSPSTNDIASSAAVNSLSSTVKQQGDTLVSQGNSITTLNNNITTINGTLNTKADSSALAALDGRVTQTENGLTTTNTDIVRLQSAIQSQGDALNLDPNFIEGLKFIAVSELATGNSVVAGNYGESGGSGLRVTKANDAGTSNTNTSVRVPTTGVWLKAGRTYRATVRARKVSGTAGLLLRWHRASNSSALAVSQVTVTDTVNFVDYSLDYTPTVDTFAWFGVWVYPNACVVDYSSIRLIDRTSSVENAATASALSSLTTRVSDVEGVNTSQSNSITSLNNSVTVIKSDLDTKASNSAVSSLESRVIDAENSLTSQSTQLTTLKSGIDAAAVIGTNMLINTAEPSSANAPKTSDGVSSVSGMLVSYGVDTVFTINSASAERYYRMTSPVNASAVLKPGNTYTISADMRGNALPVRWRIIAFANNAWADIAVKVLNTITGNQYTRQSCTFTIPANATNLIMSFQSESTVVGNTLSVRRLKLEAGSNATLWEQPTSEIATTKALNLLDTRVVSIDGKVTSHSSSITRLETDVSNSSAKLDVVAESVNGMSASYFVKTDVDGLVSGFGLYNDGVGSAFGVNADYFYIGRGSGGKKPFIVTTTPQTIDGVTYPVGTWISVALIANATIGSAHIADAAITNAHVANLDASKITTGVLDAARIRVGPNSSYDPGYNPSQKSRTFVTQPTIPYYVGDMWKSGNTTLVTTVTRATGSFTAADWVKVGDVTSENTAADSAKLGGTAASTINTNIANADTKATNAATAASNADAKATTASTAATNANNQINAWKFTGTTEIDGGKIRADTITAAQLNVNELSAISGNLGTMITYVDPSKPTGERMVIQGTAIKVYDGSNVERIFIGIR